MPYARTWQIRWGSSTKQKPGMAKPFGYWMQSDRKGFWKHEENTHVNHKNRVVGKSMNHWRILPMLNSSCLSCNVLGVMLLLPTKQNITVVRKSNAWTNLSSVLCTSLSILSVIYELIHAIGDMYNRSSRQLICWFINFY